MIDQRLGEIGLRQSQLSGRLETILESRRQRESDLASSLNSVESDLIKLRSNEAKRLISLTDGTADTAAHMSQSIRRLDREQGKILDVLQLLGRVERIHELVQMLESATIEQACQIVHDLDQFSEVSITAYESRYPSERTLGEYIEVVKGSLVAKIAEKFREVLGRASFGPADLASLFQLLALIDSTKEGVLLYSAFLNGQCKENISSLMAGLDTAHTGDLPYASALSRLLEHAIKTLHWTFTSLLTSKQLSLHREIIYEPFLGIVQEAVEALVEKFLGTIGSVEELGQAQIFKLDLAISEIALICSHLGGFEDRVNVLVFPDTYQDSYNPVLLLERYRVLELYYLKLGIDKAVQLDSAISESDLVGSSVDDAFFLIRKAVFRAMSTKGPIIAISKMVCRDILGSQFFTAINNRAPIHSSDSLDKKKAVCRSANNLTASSEFTARFVEELSDALVDSEECVQVIELFGECQKQFVGTAEKAVESIYKGLVKAKFASLLSVTIMAPSLNMAVSLEEDTIDKFTLKYPSTISEVSPWLIEENMALLTQLMATDLSALWIKHILKMKRFKQLVAVQLDRQIRSVSAFLTDLGGIQTRRVLTPILHVGELLVSESQAEAEELFVTVSDLDKKVLSLRTDW